jgi:signal peptidase I
MNRNILIEKRLRSKNKDKKSSLNFNRRRKKFDFGRLKSVLLYTALIASSILLAYGCVRSFGMVTPNSGESMTETIGSGDYLLSDRIIYKFRKPKINDVVIFSANDSSTLFVKRIVGVPGDTLYIKDGLLYVNGKARQEIKKTEKMNASGLLSNKIKLKKGEYFVLGDNRNNSEDSRFESIGNITANDIIGKVWFDIDLHHFGPI